MTVFFSVLNRKVYAYSYGKYHNAYCQNIKTFHFYSSLSAGITRYAMVVNTINNESNNRLRAGETLSEITLPRTPAVNTYLAASANILATTFLLSLFTLKVYHKEELI